MQIPRRQSGCVSVPQHVKGGGKTTAAALLNESCCTAKKELEPHQAELGMALALAVTTGSGLWPGLPFPVLSMLSAMRAPAIFMGPCRVSRARWLSRGLAESCYLLTYTKLAFTDDSMARESGMRLTSSSRRH